MSRKSAIGPQDVQRCCPKMLKYGLDTMKSNKFGFILNNKSNKYKFVFPLPSGTVVGDLITTTGTRSNSTSEFSPEIIISAYTVITNRNITYRIKAN